MRRIFTSITALVVCQILSCARSFHFAPSLDQVSSLATDAKLLEKQKQQVMSKVFDTAINVTEYPLARRDDGISDDYHGTKIADPYRWMENPDDKETQAFVDKLNNISEPFLQGSNVRKELKERLTKLWDYEKFGSPGKHGDWYYYYYNSGLQNQSVLYRQKHYKEKAEVFMDPNTWSEDGTTALSQTSWTLDGKLLAIGVSEKGSDWVTIKFRDADGKELADVITGVKFSGISWLGNEGVFYSKYPSYKSATEGSSVEKHEFHSLYYHKLGTDCKDDILVADMRENPNFMVGGSVTRDQRFLIVSVDKGCDPTNALYYYDLAAINRNITKKLELKPLFTSWDAKYGFIRNDGDEILFVTDKDAPMNKLCKLNLKDLDKGESAWETLIAHDIKRKLEVTKPVAHDKLIVVHMEDACDVAAIHDLKTGKFLEKLPLALGTVGGLSGRITADEVFLSYESFLEPVTVYRLDFAKYKTENKPMELELVRKTNIPGIDTSKYEAKQLFYKSKDGTKIPLFITHPKNIKLDSQNPTILNGYGGFDISRQPYFSITNFMFMEMFGGITAHACIRGGGEYGKTWHEAGMKENKQNVFDDFIAAGEYLVNENYTSPAKLAIQGGSNGGLLMGAVSQQRPDLFGSVINRVGVLDMLRFHKFSIGSAWVPEYGNPDDANDFKYIFKYSPLHNIRVSKSQQWPATLLMTADHDDRVVPSHTLKYIAQLYYTLQDVKDTQTNPVIARVEVKAGHGAGKPTHKIIDENVDIYAFIQRTLKVDVKH